MVIPQVRICGGPGRATAQAYPTTLSSDHEAPPACGMALSHQSPAPDASASEIHKSGEPARSSKTLSSVNEGPTPEVPLTDDVTPLLCSS